jgi:hypothetical protein
MHTRLMTQAWHVRVRTTSLRSCRAPIAPRRLVRRSATSSDEFEDPPIDPSSEFEALAEAAAGAPLHQVVLPGATATPQQAAAATSAAAASAPPIPDAEGVEASCRRLIEQLLEPGCEVEQAPLSTAQRTNAHCTCQQLCAEKGLFSWVPPFLPPALPSYSLLPIALGALPDHTHRCFILSYGTPHTAGHSWRVCCLLQCMLGQHVTQRPVVLSSPRCGLCIRVCSYAGSADMRPLSPCHGATMRLAPTNQPMPL